MFNISDLRSQFPALNQKVRGNRLAYLDSANTSLKPLSVIQRVSDFYANETANVHRGGHFLSDRTTTAFEASRENIRNFLNAKSSDEIIFTKGTTEAINLVAASFGQTFINEGDEIVITELEHHANLVPWQILAQQRKAKLKYIEVLANGELSLDSIEKQITSKTKLVAFSGCSNILGTLTPVEAIVKKAKSVGAKTLLDAAQLITQKSVDVQALDVDFLIFSAHKLFGPFGFGVLYGKKELLNQMPPYQTGGSMILTVDYDVTTFNILPFKFEAGTPHVEGAIGLSAAIDFLKNYEMTDLFNHEQKLMKQMIAGLSEISEVKLFGTAAEKASVVSFTMDGAHHSDIGQILDQQGVAVRVGHHCTQPLLKKFGLTGTVRASISIYNNEEDITQFTEAVKKARKMLL